MAKREFEYHDFFESETGNINYEKYFEKAKNYLDFLDLLEDFFEHYFGIEGYKVDE